MIVHFKKLDCANKGRIPWVRQSKIGRRITKFLFDIKENNCRAPAERGGKVRNADKFMRDMLCVAQVHRKTEKHNNEKR